MYKLCFTHLCVTVIIVVHLQTKQVIDIPWTQLTQARPCGSWHWSSEREPIFVWSKQLEININTEASAWKRPFKRVSHKCSSQSESHLIRNEGHSIIHQETLEAEGSFYVHLAETHRTTFIAIDFHLLKF